MKKTVNMKRLGSQELADLRVGWLFSPEIVTSGAFLEYPKDLQRPQTREDCEPDPRCPCPWCGAGPVAMRITTVLGPADNGNRLVCPSCQGMVACEFAANDGASWRWVKHGPNAQEVDGAIFDPTLLPDWLSNTCRPCLFSLCRYHLALDVNEESGALKYNHPDMEVEDMPHTCALDVVDRARPLSLGELAEAMGLSYDRAFQVVDEALDAAHAAAVEEGVGEVLFGGRRKGANRRGQRAKGNPDRPDGSDKNGECIEYATGEEQCSK